MAWRTVRFGIVVALGLFLLTFVALPILVEAIRVTRDGQEMQGTWTDAKRTVVIAKDRLTLTETGADGVRHVTEMTFRLNPNASPRQIHAVDAAHPGNSVPGLYEMNGDTLRLCLGAPDGPFPAGFQPEDGMVLELRRSK